MTGAFGGAVLTFRSIFINVKGNCKDRIFSIDALFSDFTENSLLKMTGWKTQRLLKGSGI